MKVKKVTMLVRHQNKNIKVCQDAEGKLISGDVELFGDIASQKDAQITVIVHGVKGENVRATFDHLGKFVSGNPDVEVFMKKKEVKKNDRAPKRKKESPSDHAKSDRHGDLQHDQESRAGADGDAAAPVVAVVADATPGPAASSSGDVPEVK